MFEPPTQLIDYRCALEAVDHDRNIARAYSVRASRDLFGYVIVELSWGRIGRRGAGLTVSFASEATAQSFVRRVLAKRESAPRRIGVAYRLANCISVSKPDAWPAPNEL